MLYTSTRDKSVKVTSAQAIAQGISKDGEIVDAAVTLEVITKGGAWFTYVNTETGRSERWQGREKVKEALANDEALKNEIEQKILAALKPTVSSDED